ncbi:hypothetical protein K6973_07060 [Streptococcus dysgalactiae]|nr:hypothetical protein K6973_07060 [Streptococcus dysgalactiae]
MLIVLTHTAPSIAYASEVNNTVTQQVTNENNVITHDFIDGNGTITKTIIEDQNSNKITEIYSDEKFVYLKVTAEGNTETQVFSKEYIVDPPIRVKRATEMIGGWYPIGPWEYTGIAVGKKVFAASFLLSYMGVSHASTGSALANILDANGNGWIGLYKRAAARYPNGPLEVYLHKTL